VLTHGIYMDKQKPPANRGLCSTQLPSDSEGVTLTVLIETVSAATRMGILHEVTSRTVGGFLRSDLPVTVSLNHRANVADGGAKVGNAKP